MAEEARIKELVAKMTQERTRLLGALESLSEEDATTPPVPGEWNSKQQMSHLCEMETAYRAWVERALAEDGASVDGVRGERPAIPLEEASRHSVAEHVAEMRRQRDKTMALIAAMKPQDFDRRATNSLFGTLTVMQWLRSYYRHDRMHYDQVRGQESSYKPQFLSGREPDQRRPATP
ncbi:MAG: DinB family protein [Chloroflexi bacterium]|nr:DinB family protein [Chloroflexota bacterium]